MRKCFSVSFDFKRKIYDPLTQYQLLWSGEPGEYSSSEIPDERIKAIKECFVQLRDTRVNSWMNEWTRGWTFSSFKYLHKFYRSLGIEENFKLSDKVYANKSAASFVSFQQTKTGGTFLHLFVRKSIYLSVRPSVRLTFRRQHITINRYRRSRIYAKDKQNPLEIYLVFLFLIFLQTHTPNFSEY